MKIRKVRRYILIVLCVSAIAFIKYHSHILSGIMYKNKPEAFTIIDIVGAEERFIDQRYLFVDARDNLFYKLGHIKNSVNIPLKDFDQIIDEFEKKYARSIKIVVYCDGSLCSSSYLLAKGLIDRGYKFIEVFIGGWRNWIDSSLPIECSNEY